MAECATLRTLDEWLDYIDRVHPQRLEMGLDRVSEVARRLDVCRPAPNTIIVAGTNGKGSTSVALEHLLLRQGLQVGTTLSPHVSRFNERIRINGVEADDARICDAFAAVDAARREISLTYFEYSALAALLLFRQAGVDVAILEVGLGGRLDAFNLVDADLAVVTSIGLDHQEYLGSDLEGIGREKAGVFRRGQKVVLGRVSESVREAAAALHCPVLALDEDVQIVESAEVWDYACPMLDLSFERLPRGALAPANCALALTAAAWLTGAGITDAASLCEVTLPGRMEHLSHQDREVILDVAHNPAGAGFLADQLERRYPGRRYVAILAMLADKDAAGVVLAMADLVTEWLAVGTTGWRGQSAAALAAGLGRPALIAEDMADALSRAVSLTGPGGGILIFGSFSAVEQARALLIHHPASSGGKSG